jgi:hypothetical protein
MAVSINVCNLALAELRAKYISDIDQTGVEAESCRIAYPQCLSLLLETHDWSFATKIATLAAYGSNTRESEWGYAYALPTDMATAKRLVPSGVLGSYADRAYYYPCEDIRALTWDRAQAFIVEAGVLYSQIPDAILEYSANTLDEVNMSAAFKDALVYSLASRMAVPIRDDRTLKGELLKQAELATQRAVADDMNRQPQRDASYSDEVTYARAG